MNEPTKSNALESFSFKISEPNISQGLSSVATEDSETKSKLLDNTFQNSIKLIPADSVTLKSFSLSSHSIMDNKNRQSHPISTNIFENNKNNHLSMLAAKLGFGLCSTHHVHNITVMIENQNTLSGLCYDQFEVLCNSELAITREEFIVMWKTIILKRMQDLYANEKKKKIENRIRLDTLLIPAPLYDLLISLDSFESKYVGSIYHLIPPEPKENSDLEEWRTIHDEILQKWINTMGKMDGKYVMDYIPTSFKESTLVLTTISDSPNGERTVRAVSSEVQPHDALVRFVNDDIFEPNDRLNFDNCDLGFNPKYRTSILLNYVGSYVKAKISFISNPQIIHIGNIESSNVVSMSDSDAQENNKKRKFIMMKPHKGF